LQKNEAFPGLTKAAKRFHQNPTVKSSILLLTLCLLSRPLPADPPPTELPGFLGIPWGASPDEAKKQFTARTHAHLDRTKSDDQRLAFIGGKFAGFKIRDILLQFASQHFYNVEFFIETTSPKHEKEFAALKAMLTEKYGKPGRDETTASGFEVNWYFPIPGAPSPTIWIIQNVNGDGVKVLYFSEGIKANAQKVAAPAPAKPDKPVKPLTTKQSDKDDL
jgi:hypothetical protein